MERRQAARRPGEGWTQAALRGLDASVTGNAQAFGFSITVTVTFGVISSAQGHPSLPELIGFALSAVAAFSALNLLVAQLFLREPSDSTPARALLVGTATDFLAVGAGVGAAIGIRYTVGGWGAWVVAPFCSGVVYVLIQSIELAVGRSKIHEQDQADT